MKAVQNTYCTVQFLDEVFKNKKTSKPHKVAFRILANLSNIYIDATPLELRELVKNNPIYKTLFKRENKSLRSKVDWKDEVSFESSDDVFFVNKEYISNYKSIRKECGCMIIANGDDLNLLNQYDEKRGYICIVPDDQQVGSFTAYQSNWQEAINTCKIEPLNSLIISDNYIFSKIDSRKDDGLFSLLRAIVPPELKVPFHLAIFSHIGNNTFKKPDADNLIQEIKSLFPAQEIKVTIVIHSKKITTHDREIISNYHRLTSGAGFSVIEEDGVKEIASGFIEPVYHSISTTREGEMTTKHFHYQSLEWLKSIYDQLLNTKSGEHTTFITGDMEHRMLDSY